MAVAVPVGSLLADRLPRQRVLFVVDVLRGLMLAGSAVAALAAFPAAVVYALAALATVVAAPYRPAQWAIMPLLSRNPQDLVAANAASSTVEGLAVLIGPGPRRRPTRRRGARGRVRGGGGALARGGLARHPDPAASVGRAGR
jgi:hypothetical protein